MRNYPTPARPTRTTCPYSTFLAPVQSGAFPQTSPCGSSKGDSSAHNGTCSQGSNSSKGGNNDTILYLSRAETSTHSRRPAPSHSTRSTTTHPCHYPPLQLMWLRNRNHFCQTCLQPDPPCNAVPGTPSLSRRILPCPGRHISSLPIGPGTISSTAAIISQNSSAPDMPMQPLSATVSKPIPSFAPPLVLFRNFSISFRASINQPGPSHWLMNLDGWPKALGTELTAPTPFTSSPKRQCLLTLKRQPIQELFVI